ncbi:hypothetical protein B0H13DRAFT_2512222 [Mycena leptocephala]|nr:hypothetical protein B0H13DRAFT_2512222 [Mycena leptocephala]
MPYKRILICLVIACLITLGSGTHSVLISESSIADRSARMQHDRPWTHYVSRLPTNPEHTASGSRCHVFWIGHGQEFEVRMPLRYTYTIIICLASLAKILMLNLNAAGTFAWPAATAVLLCVLSWFLTYVWHDLVAVCAERGSGPGGICALISLRDWECVFYAESYGYAC